MQEFSHTLTYTQTYQQWVVTDCVFCDSGNLRRSNHWGSKMLSRFINWQRHTDRSHKVKSEGSPATLDLDSLPESIFKLLTSFYIYCNWWTQRICPSQFTKQIIEWEQSTINSLLRLVKQEKFTMEQHQSNDSVTPWWIWWWWTFIQVYVPGRCLATGSWQHSSVHRHKDPCQL